MKRYLFSILFALFAVGGIVACYIYNEINHMPKYKLETIQGNPGEGAEIELSGSYYLSVFSAALDVTADGSSYSNERINFRKNILNTRAWFLQRPEIKQLVSEHRQFMRGKNNSGGFYNDEHWLIYVDGEHANRDRNVSTTDITLRIEFLQKESNETKQHELTVIADGYGFSISDVQLIDERIHVLMTIYKTDTTDISTTYLQDYIIDLSSGALISDNEMFISELHGANREDNAGGAGTVTAEATAAAAANAGERQFRLYVMSDSSIMAPSDYAIVVEKEDEIISRQGNHSYSSRPIATRYYSYSYRTGEFSVLPIMDQNNSAYSLHSNVFSHVASDTERISLSSYDLNTGEFRENFATIAASDMGGTHISNNVGHSENNRLYVLLFKDQIPLAAVINVQDGVILYTGEVIYDGPAAEAQQRMDRLHLLNIRVN